jgi:hypothetical protein
MQYLLPDTANMTMRQIMSEMAREMALQIDLLESVQVLWIRKRSLLSRMIRVFDIT